MLTLFNGIVFIHVVCAIVWIGSAVVLELLEWEAVHTSKRERLSVTLHRSSWFGKRVFTPMAILTLLTGVTAVAIGRPAFNQLWVEIALVAIVLAAALGGGVIGRTSAMLAKRIADPAVPEDEIEATLASTRWASYLDLALLFFILFDMVIRPATFDPGFFIVSGIFFVLVIGGILTQARRRPQRA